MKSAPDKSAELPLARVEEAPQGAIQRRSEVNIGSLFEKILSGEIRPEHVEVAKQLREMKKDMDAEEAPGAGDEVDPVTLAP